MTVLATVTRPISQVNQQGEDEAAQCGLQQTPTAFKTEPNHRGYIRQVTYIELREGVFLATVMGGSEWGFLRLDGCSMYKFLTLSLMPMMPLLGSP